ncbi:unnamed protein product [Heterobilharzia americana]|nr:unnamed protein product [Heterobilharzia americana]
MIYLLTCLHILLCFISHPIFSQNYHTYSYTYTTQLTKEFSSNEELIGQDNYLLCPLLHAQNGDLLVFFKSNSSIHKVILDKNNLKVNYLLKLYEIDRNAEYRCELHRSTKGDIQIISKIKLLFTPNTTYETFIYERKQTQVIEGILGEPLTLICNSKISSTKSKDRNILWYRLPSLQINEQNSVHLHFNKLKEDDLGVYFCSDQSNLSRHLPVQKIEIWSSNYVSEINFGRLINGTDKDYYICPNILNKNTFVIWEYPMGNVVVNEFSDKLIHSTKYQFLTYPSPICQYSWIDNTNETLDSQFYLKEYVDKLN